MTDISREELLGAYMDDELSAEERARVEESLAASPELRQLLTDLLAVRQDLQSLPRHKLDRDLTPAVLQRAERSVLGGAPASARPSNIVKSAAGLGPEGDDITPGTVFREWWSRGSWRRLAWPAMAIAAALAIAFFETRNEKDVPQVALRAPRHEGAFEAANSTAPTQADADDLSVTRADDKRGSDMNESAATSLVPAAVLSKEAEKNAIDRAAGQMAPAVPMAAPAEAELRRDSAGERANKREAGGGRGGAAAGDRPADEERFAQPAMQDKLEVGKVVGQSESAPRADNLDVKSARPAGEVSVVEFTVEPDFLRDKRIERLLTEKKIAYSRMVPEAKDQNRAAATPSLREANRQELAASQAELIEQYAVTVTPDQLNQLVAELEQASSRRSRQLSPAPVQAGAKFEYRPQSTSQSASPDSQLRKQSSVSTALVTIRLRASREADALEAKPPGTR